MMFLMCFASLRADIISEWDFNSSEADADSSTGTFDPRIGTGSCAAIGANSSFGTVAGGKTSDPQSDDNSQLHMASFPARDAGSRSAGIQISASTAGFQNIRLEWDQYNSATASRYWRIQYSSDGGLTWNDADVIVNTTPSVWTLKRSVDFAAVPALNDNPNIAIRLVSEFESTATGSGSDNYAAVKDGSNYSSAGTLWLDMFILSGDPLSTGPGSNTAPSISAVADQTISRNHETLSVEFTISDFETAPDELVVTATSSDPALFTEVTVEGTGSNRVLKLVPAVVDSGSARVTLRVTDPLGASGESSFEVRLLPRNTPPVLEPIPDQHTPRNTPIGPLPIIMTDSETPAGQLSLSIMCSNPELLPATGILIGGTYSERTLTLVPEMNALGTATISVVIGDGEFPAATTFQVDVRPATLLAQWTFDTADPDGDPKTGTLDSQFGTGTLGVIGDLSQSFGTVAGGPRTGSAVDAADDSMLRLASFPAQSTGNKTAGIEIHASTLGQKDLVLMWDQYNSSSSSAYWRVQYSTNGTDFIDFTLITNSTPGAWTTNNFADFYDVPGVRNNSQFAIRLVSEFESTALGFGTDEYRAADPAASYSRAGTLWLDRISLFAEPSGDDIPPPGDSADPAILEVQRVAGTIRIAWPVEVTGGILEEADNPAGEWKTVEITPVQEDASHVVMISTSKTASYFRLWQPN
jgi:hypothetical protein